MPLEREGGHPKDAVPVCHVYTCSVSCGENRLRDEALPRVCVKVMNDLRWQRKAASGAHDAGEQQGVASAAVNTAAHVTDAVFIKRSPSSKLSSLAEWVP